MVLSQDDGRGAILHFTSGGIIKRILKHFKAENLNSVALKHTLCFQQYSDLWEVIDLINEQLSGPVDNMVTGGTIILGLTCGCFWLSPLTNVWILGGCTHRLLNGCGSVI